MAERRMFHIRVVGSDAFISMPHWSQLLYFHLCMQADEDGFVNSPLQVVRSVGLRETDLMELLDRRFLLQVDGVLIIKHWKLANTSKNDRMRELQYPEVAKKIYIRPNGIYTDHPVEGGKTLLEYKQDCLAHRTGARTPRKSGGESKPEADKAAGIQLDSTGIPSRSRAEHKQSISRAVAVAEQSTAEPPDAAATAEMKYLQGELGKGVVLLSDRQISDLLDRMGIDAFDQYVDKLATFIVKKQAKVKNHYATILQWWQEDSKVKGA